MPHPTGSPAVIFVAVTGVSSKLLKALIDPNAASVRSLSREERELMIAANNGYLLAFDNLSNLPVWLSTRCAGWRAVAASPYGGYTATTRRCCLKRRVISRPDLGDRAIFLTLAPIGEAQRRLESELWREFKIARPRIKRVGGC
jgi:hypothetical protein